MTPLRISVLDQSTAAQGRGQDDAIRETLESARHCEALGYHRYWVSEHHNSDSIVGTAPEVLMAAIAATTRAHPRGQRRRDAAALLGAQGGRAVPRARGDRARPDRSWRRPRARLRPADRLRAQSACERRGRISAAGARSAGLGRGRPVPDDHPFRAIQRASARIEQARGVDSRQLGLRRAARGALRSAVCVRVLLQRRTRRRGGAASVSYALSAERRPSRAAGHDLRLGARGRHRRRSAAPAEHARALARRASSRDSAARCCLPTRRPRRRTHLPNRRPSSACARTRSWERRIRWRRGCASSRRASRWTSS